jgi:chromosome segregation ATPase
VLGLLEDNTRFRQELQELKLQGVQDKGRVSELEEREAQLMASLAESKRAALQLQESLSALSHSASQLESDIQSKASSNRAEVDANVSVLKSQLRGQQERADHAELELNRAKFDLEEKVIEFDMVLRDLIKSRLEFAEVSSDNDEKNKLCKTLQNTLRESSAQIKSLETQLAEAKRKKSLF